MQNTITDLIPVMYKALDTVAREMVGFARSVQLDASAEMVAKDQVLNTPVVGAKAADNITPGVTAPEAAGETIGTVPISITKARRCDIGWNGEQMKAYRSNGTYERTLADQFAQAIRTLVNEVEVDLGLEAALRASRAYGTANTNPFPTANDMIDFAMARKILDDNGAPGTDLHLILNSGAMANLRGKMSNLFKANEAGSPEFLRTGALFDVNGLAVHTSAGVAAPVVGTGSAYTLNGAHSKGATSLTLQAGSNPILAGDVISFAADTVNKYVVKTGRSGAGVIEIWGPGLMTDLPTANAMTIVARSARNIVHHRSAIILLARQPAMPEGGDSADDVYALTDPVSGITFQVAKYRQYRQIKYEVALAWGQRVVKPEFVGQLLGQF